MRFLHISDLHIGKRVNGFSMLEDQRHILGQIADIAVERQVDALVVAGDIYDKSSPSAEAVTVVDGFLTSMASLGIQVIAIPGNHDSAERIAYAQGLLGHEGIHFPPVFDGGVERVELEDAHGKAVFWLLPFLKPADVRRFFPEQDIGDDYAKALDAVIGACGVDTAVRNVAVSHQLVTAFGASPDRADEEIKLGGVDNVDASVYDAFDYVALGHVHRPQRVGRDTVRYSGSPLKYSFSEARYDKSAVLVELGPKGAAGEECVEFELVPLAPLHDMREVRMTLSDLLEQGAQAQEDALDYLHVTLTDEHPQIDAMRRVHELYPNAMALDYDNAAILQARAQVKEALDPDGMDMVELFARFYEEQAGSAMDDVQREIVASAARNVERAVARGEAHVEGGAR